MRILLTNDDGIQAAGIMALYQQLKKFAQVTIVAPDSERSSVGHGITLSHPLWIKKIKLGDGTHGYACSGTPADCVKLAVSLIYKKNPDLVVSGINLGANDGCSVFYSGTIAGAREGALIGIQGMAVSINTFTLTDFKPAAKVTTRLIKVLPRLDLPPQTFLNVNIPGRPLSKMKGIRFTRQGMDPIHGKFHKKRDPYHREYYWMSAKTPPRRKDLDQDTHALPQGYVTVTPIHCDMTATRCLDTLRRHPQKIRI